MIGMAKGKEKIEEYAYHEEIGGESLGVLLRLGLGRHGYERVGRGKGRNKRKPALPTFLFSPLPSRVNSLLVDSSICDWKAERYKILHSHKPHLHV